MVYDETYDEVAGYSLLQRNKCKVYLMLLDVMFAERWRMKRDVLQNGPQWRIDFWQIVRRTENHMIKRIKSEHI